MDPDLSAFEQTRACAQSSGDIARCETAGLNVAGVTNSTKPSFSLSGLASVFEAGNFPEFHGFVQTLVVVAGVILQGDWCLVGELGDEVAPPDLVLTQPHFPPGTGDNALKQVGGFGAACAPVGVDRDCVGEPGVHLNIDLRGGVLASQKRCVQDGWNRARER